MPKAAVVLEQARRERGLVEEFGNKGLEKMYQMYGLWGRKVSKEKLKKKLQKQGIQII